MSCTMISFDKERDQFSFGASDYTWNDLGSRIAQALSERKELVDFGCVHVTVGYLTGMMRFTRKHGWFSDNFDIKTGDHDFDANVITPGAFWSGVRKLQRHAAVFRTNAHKASWAHVQADADYWLAEARKFEDLVREYLSSGTCDEWLVRSYVSAHEE